MKTLITGVDSGLGKALFERFSQLNGPTTYGTTVNQTRDLPNLIPLYIGPGETVSGSMSMFNARVCQRIGDHIDILINNVGINFIEPFPDISETLLIRMMRVNMILPVKIIQTLLEHLTPGGRVINIVSESSWKPMRHSLAYCCSKAAMTMASKVMARELTKPYRVSIISINTGRISGTKMTQGIDKQIEEMGLSAPAKSQVCRSDHTPEALADIIYGIANSNHFPTMSGAEVNLVG